MIRRGGHRNAVDGVLTLELRPLITIGGRILDKDGQPRAGVRVTLCERNGTDSEDFTWHAPVTDAEGRWQTSLFEDRIKWRDFACLLEPTRGKWLRAKRLTRDGREALLAGTHEIRIGKARSSSHAEDLTALDSSSRKSDRETLLALRVLNSGQQLIAGASARPLQIEVEKRAAPVPADADGQYTLLIPKPGKNIHLRMHTKGYYQEETVIEVDGRREVTYDVALKQHNTLRGIVLTADGQPCPDAAIGATDCCESLSRGLPIDRHVGSRFVRVRTDAAGEFEMTSLRNRYQVMALTHAGYATAIVEPGDTDLTLPIRPYCRVSGRWAFKTGEGQDSVLRLKAVCGASDRPGTYSGGTTEVNPQTGEFSFDQVLPGSYSICCDDDEARNVPHLRREYHFNLAESEQLELTVPLVEGSLIGRIVTSDDVKVTDIRINLRPSEEITQQRQKISKLQYEQRRDPEHELAMTPAGRHATLLSRRTCHPAEDGTFKIEHLPAGKLRVLIQNKAVENQTLEIEIPPCTGEPPWPPRPLPKRPNPTRSPTSPRPSHSPCSTSPPKPPEIRRSVPKWLSS